MAIKYCPHCKSKKSLVKSGFLRSWNNYEKQRWLCKVCHRQTVVPLESK